MSDARKLLEAPECYLDLGPGSEPRSGRPLKRIETLEVDDATIKSLDSKAVARLLNPLQFIYDEMRMTSGEALASFASTRREGENVYRLLAAYDRDRRSSIVYFLATPEQLARVKHKLAKLQRGAAADTLKEDELLEAPPEYWLGMGSAAQHKYSIPRIEKIKPPEPLTFAEVDEILGDLRYVDASGGPYDAETVASLMNSKRADEKIVRMVSQDGRPGNEGGLITTYFLATPEQLESVKQKLERLKRGTAADELKEDELLEAPECRLDTEEHFPYASGSKWAVPRISSIVPPVKMNYAAVKRFMGDLRYVYGGLNSDETIASFVATKQPDQKVYRLLVTYDVDRHSSTVYFLATPEEYSALKLKAERMERAEAGDKLKEDEQDPTLPIATLKSLEDIKIQTIDAHLATTKQISDILAPYEYVIDTEDINRGSAADFTSRVTALANSRKPDERIYVVARNWYSPDWSASPYVKLNPEQARTVKEQFDRIKRGNTKDVVKESSLVETPEMSDWAVDGHIIDTHFATNEQVTTALEPYEYVSGPNATDKSIATLANRMRPSERIYRVTSRRSPYAWGKLVFTFVRMTPEDAESVQAYFDKIKRGATKDTMKESSAKQLINRLTEAPVDTGGFPDYIHPSRRQQLRTGKHPYGKHPGMAQTPGRDNTPEKLASRRYQSMMGRLQQHAGQGNPMVPVAQGLQTALRAEPRHKAALEKLAVELVFELPEFQSAKAAYEAGHFKIDAKLTGQEQPDLGPGRVSREQNPDAPDLEDPDFNPEVDYDAIDAEKQKRQMVNALIHGAAVNADYSFQMVKGELDRIDPALAPAYAKVMAGTQLGYWMVPDEMLKGLAAQGGTMGGASVGSAKLDQDGKVPVVKARGMIFPVLVHELVKGLTELVSYAGLPKSGAMKKAVLKGDTLDAETWDLLLGPEIWRNLTDAVGTQDRKLLMHAYDALVKMPPDKFHAATRGLTAGGDEAKKVAQDLLKLVKR